MSDPSRAADAAAANAFDRPDGYSGQEYTRDREAEEAARDPSGRVNPHGDMQRREQHDGTDIPPEAGTRAFFDPATGAVHGSGAGAGGGNPGEDFDSDPGAGDGAPLGSG